MKISLSVMLALLLSVLIAAVTLYRTASSASRLEYRPDSVEYAGVGHRLAFHGTTLFPLEGESYPSRYLPWFSALVATPLYLILGPDPGNPIYGVLLFGVLGVIAAFGVGYRISGLFGGSLAVCFLIGQPLYRLWGREIMTDVPTTAMVLTSAYAYVRQVSMSAADRRLLTGAGIAVAMAAAFKPLAVVSAIPFVILVWRRGWIRNVRLCAAVFAPVIAVVAMGMLYNELHFGSPFRNGYHFWTAVPYDYPSLVFSIAYLRDNWTCFLISGAAIQGMAALVAWIVLKRCRSDAAEREAVDAAWHYTLAVGIPLALVHLFYFYPDARFFLPLSALLTTGIGGMVGALLPRRDWVAILILMAGLAAAVGFRATHHDAPPEPRQTIERIASLIGKDSIVISSINPLYVHFMMRFDESITVIPLSRRTEYAAKYVSPRKTHHPEPPPQGPRDHRCEGLLRDGNSREAMAIVADENPEWLEDRIRAGRHVFVNTAISYPNDKETMDRLAARFRCVARAPDLYELYLSHESGRSQETPRERAITVDLSAQEKGQSTNAPTGP